MGPKQRKLNLVDSVFNDSEPVKDGEIHRRPVPSYYDMAVELGRVLFTLALPLESLKYYPQHYLFIFGSIAYFLMGSIFLYFAVTGYFTQSRQEFVSLDPTVGICHHVLQTLTLQTKASQKGYWEGSVDFEHSDAPFRFSFNKLEVNDHEFAEVMGTFAAELHALGQFAANSPLVANMLLLMHWGAEIENDDFDQIMTFTSSPQDVYNRRHVVANVGNATHLCSEVPPISSFNVEAGVMELTYDVDAYTAAGCNDIASMKYSLGWEERDFHIAVVQLDTISISTAMAVAVGIIHPDKLEIVDEPKPLYRDMLVSMRYDPFFPRMKPLLCLSIEGSGLNITEDSEEYEYSSYEDYRAADGAAEEAYRLLQEHGGGPICFVDFHGQFALPSVHHWLEECNSCDTAPDHDPYCDYHDFILGVTFFPGHGHWVDIVKLYFKYSSFQELGRELYKPALSLSNDVSDSSNYDFCDGECVFVGMNVWDDHRFVSDHFVTRVHAHCADTFSLSEDALHKLATVPPAVLVETYFRCKMFPSEAFVSAVGIAVGNLGAFGPFAIFGILLPLIYIYFTLLGAEPPKERYDLVRIMKAQREFIEKVLAANDGSLEYLPYDSVIRTLGRELYELAEFEEGKIVEAEAAKPGRAAMYASNAKIEPVPAEEVGSVDPQFDGSDL